MTGLLVLKHPNGKGTCEFLIVFKIIVHAFLCVVSVLALQRYTLSTISQLLLSDSSRDRGGKRSIRAKSAAVKQSLISPRRGTPPSTSRPVTPKEMKNGLQRAAGQPSMSCTCEHPRHLPSPIRPCVLRSALGQRVVGRLVINYLQRRSANSKQLNPNLCTIIPDCGTAVAIKHTVKFCSLERQQVLDVQPSHQSPHTCLRFCFA